MYNNGRIRNIEIPENLFSNLGELKNKKKVEEIKEEIKDNLSTSIKEIKQGNDIKLTNFEKHGEYRERITKMYEDIKELKPIDNEIDNILYFNNYAEKGIVVKPKISSLKQFWTEYRLIKNEKNVSPELTPVTEKKVDDFDQLFEALSVRVLEINQYIDELKEMKKSMDIASLQLKENEQKLKEDKEEFQNYKSQEETKIKEEKENLKINFERLQTIINDLDKKLESIDKTEN